MTAAILKRAGYTVITASNGREAVELFQSTRKRVSLLLFDVVMPEMGGKESSDAIHEINPSIPVLFISGYSDNGIHCGFVLREGTHLLQKPFSSESLLKKIRKILDKSSQRSNVR